MTPADADAVAAASHLFDYEVRSEWVQRFLTQPGHHLCISYLSGHARGFVSGVELTHRTRAPRCSCMSSVWTSRFDGAALASRSSQALVDLARDRGCYGVWVLTDLDNVAAVRTYTSAGLSEPREQLMLSYPFDHCPKRATPGTLSR